MNKILTYKNQLNHLAELGWQEKKTTDYIYKTLLPLQPIKYGFGKEKTGLLYQVGEGKNNILLRADIDALKTQKGTKHICGHSTHTAALMECLKKTIPLSRNLEKLNKSILFLFQPSEENFPSGAKAFLTEYGKNISSITAAFATHVQPLLPLGIVGIRNGALWARGDYMEIEIHGKMAHIKDSQKDSDAIEAAALCILFIKKIQRKFNNTIRINIGVMQGGLQANTIADFSILKGDIRLKKNSQQNTIKNLIAQEIKSIQRKTETKISFKYYDGYPVMKNDSHLAKALQSYLVNKEWEIKDDASLFSFGCEDFCFISSRIPSVMSLIGTGDKYDIHELNCTISDEGTMKVYGYFSEIVKWWMGN